MRKLVLVSLFISVSSLPAQEKSFMLGAGVSGYFAFKSPSMLYNGSQSYSISRIFSNPFFRDQINNELIYNNELLEPAVDPRYSPSIGISAHAGYFFNDMSCLVMEASFTTLRINEVFTMYVDEPNVNTPGRPIKSFPITGKEARTHIDLAYRFVISEALFGRGWFSLGVHGNFTQFKENKIQIGNLHPYDISNPFWHIDNNFPQGFGWGFLSGFTQEIAVGEDFALEVGVNAYWHTIKMADKTQELVNEKGFSFLPHIRIVWMK